MSPEQAMERVLDPRSDLFSMGTLLFQLATGQLPFPGSNPSIILRNISEGNRPEVLELAPDISGTLADLIERLLQNNIDDRPANAAAVEAALVQSLAEVKVEYETLQGWKCDISKARTYAELPPNARAYLQRIEKLCGVPVSWVGVGPGREEMATQGFKAL
jgi:serine/threonine protein kinase